MQIFTEIGPMKAYLKDKRLAHSSIGFVPTMGALHQGHASLFRSSKRENNTTICSIYVNPTQFNNPSDLDKYPRPFDQDVRLLEENGCDAAFCPGNSEMYGESSFLKFDFGHLDKILEGEFRPGHFSGVALVVSKLFHIIQPDRAYFGQKDFQQFKIISNLVNELKFDISLVCAPIVREKDGLAMSSRNIRLTAAERKRATLLYQCLAETRDRLLVGEPLAALKKEMKSRCQENHVRMEYLELVDNESFTLRSEVTDPKTEILLMGAYVGEVRLIDNIFLKEV